MKEDKLNKIARIEKAIKEKYGKEAIQNPRSNWDENKEKQFVKASKEFYAKKSKASSGKLERTYTDQLTKRCQTCSKEWFFMDLEDELCFMRWSVCRSCYIDYVQGREEKWLSSQAADKESVFKNL